MERVIRAVCGRIKNCICSATLLLFSKGRANGLAKLLLHRGPDVGFGKIRLLTDGLGDIAEPPKLYG